MKKILSVFLLLMTACTTQTHSRNPQQVSVDVGVTTSNKITPWVPFYRGSNFTPSKYVEAKDQAALLNQLKIQAQLLLETGDQMPDQDHERIAKFDRLEDSLRWICMYYKGTRVGSLPPTDRNGEIQKALLPLISDIYGKMISHRCSNGYNGNPFACEDNLLFRDCTDAAYNQSQREGLDPIAKRTEIRETLRAAILGAPYSPDKRDRRFHIQFEIQPVVHNIFPNLPYKDDATFEDYIKLEEMTGSLGTEIKNMYRGLTEGARVRASQNVIKALDPLP